MRIAGLALLLALSGSSLLAQAPAPAPAPAKAKPTAAPARIPSYKDLKFPPLRQIQIPNVESVTLPNGLRLYLLEDHELPLVSGTALVRTGNLFDPAGKVGVATVTGMVMRTGGTPSKTGDQIDVELENIAASVESNIGETSGSVSFSCLKENTDEVLAIFRDLLTSPEFRQDKIELAKTGLRSSIARRNDDPSGIADREFTNIAYGRNTPYGWMMEYEHVASIQRDDLIAFHKRYFFPANIMLAVYGDFSAAEMKARIEKTLGGWNYTQPPVPPFPEVQERAAAGIYLAAKPDVNQTFFAIGHLGGILRDKDYAALQVMGDILGGSFRSRLFQRVRTQMGAAYNISGGWGANYQHPGLFEISGSTKSASTEETLKAVREEIERLRSSEVTEEELKTAKDTVLNGFVFNFDTKSKTLNRILRYEYHGYPRDFIFQYQKAVAAVTRADVLRVAKERLKPSDLTIVAVGNPAEFGKPLTDLGPVSNLDLTIPEPKREAAAASADTLGRGKQLLAKVQQALGGTDRLAGIKDTTTSAEVLISQGGMKAKQMNRWIGSGHFRQETELPFGKLVAYSDGKTGWLVTPQGTAPLAGPMLKQVQDELFRIYPLLFLSDRLAGRTVNYAGPGVLEISDAGNSVRLQVDESTGLPSKETHQAPGAGGAPATVEEIYADFREIDGVKVPFKITILQNGTQFAEVKILEFKINSGLKPEDLSKKP